MWDSFVRLLAEQDLLLLFFVASVGHLLGKFAVRGVSLGVSAILFVGLAISAWNADLVLPALYSSLGLVIFVYSIGVANGPTFVNALRRGGGGRRSSLAVAVGIVLAVLLLVALTRPLHLAAPLVAGLFAGALTNTPALAGAVQAISGGTIPGLSPADASLAVVGYSVAYPLGVLGPILAIIFWQRRYKINYRRDAQLARTTVSAVGELHSCTVRITNLKYHDVSLKTIMREHRWHVVFGRIRRGDEEWLATSNHRHLQPGDLLSVIGAPEDVEAVTAELGEEAAEELDLDLTQYDRHRVIVSSKSVAGRKIRELRLPQRYGAMITRVKRGDLDMLAHKDFVLEFGDRVRILAPLDKVYRVRQFLGDSYNDVSKINIVGIGIGICAGLLLGRVSVPLPGDVVLRLGDAGGPLVVGLLLGVVHRTGKIIWGIPYTANLTLREFGLMLMLAGIGTRSGQTFVSALQSSHGPAIFALSAVVSLLVPFLFLPFVYKKMKLPFATATGILAGLHTQPAVHAYAVKQAGNELPNQGYAVIFPTALILKVIIAQVLLLLLTRGTV